MAEWTRKQFSANGITQYPPGPALSAVQSTLGGAVVLMIDVSGSMSGAPIQSAVAGAKIFVDEAVAARYRVGLMLWNTGVTEVAAPTNTGMEARAILDRNPGASGGNHLLGPLEACHDLLRESAGDRVVALFGDGDLTPTDLVLEKVAAMKLEGIRFVTRGLGSRAAAAFGAISDEDPALSHVGSLDDLTSGIASMANSLGMVAGHAKTQGLEN
jgi:hypothetical protein